MQLSVGWWIAGEIIVDGTDFRNAAHFRFKADTFATSEMFNELALFSRQQGDSVAIVGKPLITCILLGISGAWNNRSYQRTLFIPPNIRKTEILLCFLSASRLDVSLAEALNT